MSDIMDFLKEKVGSAPKVVSQKSVSKVEDQLLSMVPFPKQPIEKPIDTGLV
jgi:hypothetical protein